MKLRVYDKNDLDIMGIPNEGSILLNRTQWSNWTHSVFNFDSSNFTLTRNKHLHIHVYKINSLSLVFDE